VKSSKKVQRKGDKVIDRRAIMEPPLRHQNSDPSIPSLSKQAKLSASNGNSIIGQPWNTIGTTSGNSIPLGTIAPPQTFGEVSMLIDGKASSSVIANTDEVEVIVLDKNFINIMFVRYPDMAGRFYHYLASVLARRLSFHESAISHYWHTQKKE